MPEHTPPPWLAHDELPRGYPSPGTYMRSDGGFVTLTEADYSYARRCVNAHDALVEACQAWMDFSRETKAENPCPDYALRARLREQAKQLTIAALALAEPPAKPEETKP